LTPRSAYLDLKSLDIATTTGEKLGQVDWRVGPEGLLTSCQEFNV
jgi:hypothetical protein